MKIVVLLLLVVFSTTAYSSNQYSWYGDRVKWLYPEANGNLIIVFEEAPSACTHPDGYFRVSVGVNGVTQEAANKFYSLALTAATTGKVLRVNFDTHSSNCYINRMLVNFIE